MPEQPPPLDPSRLMQNANYITEDLMIQATAAYHAVDPRVDYALTLAKIAFGIYCDAVAIKDGSIDFYETTPETAKKAQEHIVNLARRQPEGIRDETIWPDFVYEVLNKRPGPYRHGHFPPFRVEPAQAAE